MIVCVYFSGKAQGNSPVPFHLMITADRLVSLQCQQCFTLLSNISAGHCAQVKYNSEFSTFRLARLYHIQSWDIFRTDINDPVYKAQYFIISAHGICAL